MTVQQRSAPSGPLSARKYTVAVVHGTIATATFAEATVAVAGAQITDLVTVNSVGALPALTGVVGARVSAAGVVAVRMVNYSAASNAAGTVTYLLELSKHTT